MKKELNQVEKDFIEFLSLKKGRSTGETEKIFLETRKNFRFAGPRYRDLCDKMHNLFRIMYDDKDEASLVESYKFHELAHLLRMISYSYPAVMGWRDYWQAAREVVARGADALLKGDFARLATAVKRGLRRRGDEFRTAAGSAAGDSVHLPLAAYLAGKIGDSPVIVDYGCGLGLISFEIGRLMKMATVYLVDMDTLILEFARFRFKKHNIASEVITVTKKNMYPALPPHDLCIIVSVMEHLARPLEAYRNIRASLKSNGILYGNFADTKQEMFHVSPDLARLRETVASDFDEIGECCYRRRN
jgi:SAM-dependent methyltransferase